MILNGKEYDASKPLEIFRANEEINALKRRELLSYIEKLKIIKEGNELSIRRSHSTRYFLSFSNRKRSFCPTGTFLR
jgi:hypothetical protein